MMARAAKLLLVFIVLCNGLACWAGTTNTAGTIVQWDNTNVFILKSGTQTNLFPWASGGVYKYEWIGAQGIQAPGAQPATIAKHGTGVALTFADNLVKDCVANIKIPDDMDTSQTAQLCVGWDTPTTSKTCVWSIVYLITALDEDVTAAATATCTNLALSSATASGLNVTPICTITAGVSDVCMHMTISRLGNATDDTIGDAVYMDGIALKYTATKLGEAK